MPEGEPDNARPFLARAVHGLEELCAGEVRERAGGRKITTTHRGVLFSSAHTYDDLIRLRSADDVFLVLATFDGLSHTRAALAELRGISLDTDIHPALQWLESARPLRLERGFEVVGSFVGRRNYTRFDIEEVVGDAIGARTGMTLRRMRERVPPLPDLSFRVHLDGAAGLIALRLAAAPLWQRPYKLRSVPGSLHPPLAYAMTRVAGLVPGQMLVDPFCGAGTIPIEAALSGEGTRVIAMDLSVEALAAAVENAARAGRRPHMVRTDSAHLPLRSGSVDRLVSNLPWMRQVGYGGHLALEPDRLWGEIARVLAPGGAAVLLGPTSKDDAAMLARGLQRSAVTRVSLFGTWAEISIAHPARQ